jgi:hypothetical protein
MLPIPYNIFVHLTCFPFLYWIFFDWAFCFHIRFTFMVTWYAQSKE